VQSDTHGTTQVHATQSEAEPKTPDPHTGLKTGSNHVIRGPGKTAHWSPAIGSRRDMPNRHRGALPCAGATLSSRSAPEMKAARKRPGPPACTTWSAQPTSSEKAGAPRRPKDRAAFTHRQKHIFTERDRRKGPPAENKARCNRTNTPHSKATQRKAKPNQKPQTHTQGKRQGKNIYNYYYYFYFNDKFCYYQIIIKCHQKQMCVQIGLWQRSGPRCTRIVKR
jgi:hypothetical protein